MSVKSGFADSHVRISANILDRIPEIVSHGFTLYAVIKPSWSGIRRTSNQYDFIKFWNSDDTGSVEYPWQDTIADEGSGDDPPPLKVEEIHPSGGRVPHEPAAIMQGVTLSFDL
jgi:hypothetical protein